MPATPVWNEENLAVLIKVVLEESRRLGRTDSGFKKATWTRMVTIFNQRVSGSFEKAQLQSKVGQLKKKYSIYSALMDNSGFGVCPTTGRPTAPAEVWDAYVLKHPGAKEFQHTALPHYNELHEIFGSFVATGRHARSATMATEQVAEAPESVLDDSTISSPPASEGGTGFDSTNDTPASTESDGHVSDTPGIVNASPDRASNCPPTKRARTSNGHRISHALEMIAGSYGRRVRMKSRTPVQVAISAFVSGLGMGLVPEERVKYIRYFVSNPIAAEAFNVLDRNTQVAFLASLDLE